MKWVKIGKWKWRLDIVDMAQERDMRYSQNYGLSLEEVLLKYYSIHKQPV